MKVSTTQSVEYWNDHKSKKKKKEKWISVRKGEKNRKNNWQKANVITVILKDFLIKNWGIKNKIMTSKDSSKQTENYYRTWNLNNFLFYFK